MNEKEVYLAALSYFGIESQTTMVFEEMAELQKELCKALRGTPSLKNIAEEIADVEIMLEQMKEYYSLHDFVRDSKEYKIKRLEKILKEI